MRRMVLALCIVLVGSTAHAEASKWKPEISLPAVIGDHMVLQAGMPAPIWGKTAPNARVRVKFDSKAYRTKSDADGKWMVRLEPMNAGGPHELSVKCRRSEAIVHDILVGDVWVCSGQSNMEWPVQQSNNPEEEIKNANYPAIRLFSVEKKVSGEPLDGCVGRWQLCSPETVKDFTAVGYFFGRRIHQTLGCPVGLIDSSWGGTPAESWTSMDSLKANPDFAPILKRWEDNLANYPAAKAKFDTDMAAWEKAAAEAKAKGEPEPRRPGAPMGPDHPWRAAGLYNGMINPLIPYAIHGAIWYQGESNAGRAYQYRTLFPAMISDWRTHWGQGDFPFFWVQLANFMKPNPDPNAGSAWAELREAQSMTLSLPNSGQAVIIDIGEADDIHPRNKQDVGSRLAQAAWKVAFGMEDAVWSGPVYDSMQIQGNSVRVKFNNADGGLMANGGGPVHGFAVAGSDHVFKPAEAKIDGDSVVVSSAEVAQPVAVRYAWADNPYCNLYNGAGLPASPFRTDTWPGVTVNEK